jgi:hypothetical protein
MSKIAAGPTLEPELGGAGTYKIHGRSEARTLVETLANTHRILTLARHALTLVYRSLRSNWHSIRNGCEKNKKVREIVSVYFIKVPTGKDSEESEEKRSQCGRTHLVEGSCVEVV